MDSEIHLWQPLQVHDRAHMTYAIEAWYSMQVVLQNSIERINKFAIKLTLNDFSSTSLLERLKWKPISRTVMGKKIILINHYVKGRITFLDDAIFLRAAENQRKSTRIGHALELNMSTTRLETVLCSSLNTSRKIWNSLPVNVINLGHPTLLGGNDGIVYQSMVDRNVIRKAEEFI